MTSARVVVFGATGFIGSHLVASLPCSETRIIVRRPLQGWRGEQVEVPHLAAEFDFKTMLEGCTTVVNLAGHAHTSEEAGPRHGSECHKINAEFPGRLAAACRDSHVQRLVHVSSLHAVATECDEVLSEESVPRPTSSYGRSKLAGEAALQSALGAGRTSWTILRPPLVYGAENPANMSKLIRIVRRDIPLPLGSVKNRRSFIYVKNLIDVIIRCLDHPGAANQILHASDDHDVSTADLIRMLAQALRTKAILLPVPDVVLDILQALPGGGALRKLRASLATHIARLKSRLDWNPPFPMEKGIAETANAFVRRLPS
jgi:nucleoside-diphosphate-sugar epimerase